MTLKLFASASVFACAVFACSGATPSDIDAPPGSSTFTNNPSDAGKSVTPTPTSTSTSTPGNPGVDSGTQGFGADSGSPQQVDSGTPPSTVTTYCGDSLSCTGNTPQCCAETPANTSDPFNLQCISQGSTCNGVPISCRDQASCKGGQVCCGDRDATSGYKDLECRTSCNPGNVSISTATQFRMCDPNAATDECTALGAGWSCSPSTALPGFGFCDDGN